MSTTVSGVVKKLTDKAVLMEIEGDDVWIPFSVIEDGEDDLEEGQDADLEIKTWFAKQEGID